MPFARLSLFLLLVSIFLGSNHLYYLVNPKNNEKSEGSPDEVDWNFAQKEMAEATGFQTGFGSGLSKGILQYKGILFSAFSRGSMHEVMFHVLLKIRKSARRW